MKAKTWAPVLTFVTVVGVGVAVALVHDGGGASPARSGPRVLKLAAGSNGAQEPAAAGGSSGYRLATALSGDKPADQQAFELTHGPADRDVVAKLADALHAGVPARSGEGWQAGGLTVSGRAGQPWVWSSCAPPTPVAPDGPTAGSGCAVSSGVAGSTPPPDVPVSTVKDAVRPVFASVGLDVDRARVDISPYGGSATWTPDGVSGMDTQAVVDRNGTITSASGWLGDRVPGDTYPVVSAKDAYGDLPALAHPDLCRIGPDGKGCLPPDPVEVVGARLGLSLQPTSDGGAVLVPSWLFATRPAGTIAVIAVEAQYRQSAPPPTQQPRDLPATTDPGSGSGGGSAPGGPGVPTEVAPAPPQDKPTP